MSSRWVITIGALPLSTTLAPLRNQVFRSIWISTQVSSLG
ncbi:MFS transporter [Mesorhizobium sp. M0644]